MKKKQQKKEIKNALNYLITEGFVVKMKNKRYRLKTDKELKKEFKNL